MRYAFTLAGKTHHVVVEEHAEGPRFVVEGASFSPEVTTDGDIVTVAVGDEKFAFRFTSGRIEDASGPIDVSIRRARPELVRRGGSGRKGDGRVRPPMPGKVVEVHVKEGQSVGEGDVLVVLEAMKMQNDVKSPVAGTISKVHVTGGQNVEATTVLVEVDPSEEA